MNLDIFPVDWTSGDVVPEDPKEDPWYRITAFGKTPAGESATLHVRFTPYFFVELPSDWSEARGRLFVTETVGKHRGVASKSMLVRRKSAWGFTNNAARLMAQLAFPTKSAAQQARRALAKQHQTYEATVEPLIRVFHLRKISPAGWISASGCQPPKRREANTDVELETSFERLSPGVHGTRPPLVIASWDIETYSESGKFPLPENPRDYLVQISTAFQRYGDPEPYLRTVVCFRDTAPVEGAEIVSCEREHEVINEWIRLVRREKTDVLIGYNTMQ